MPTRQGKRPCGPLERMSPGFESSGRPTSESGPDVPPVGLGTMTRSLETASNYHRWLFSYVKPYIGQRVLEIGAGSGNMTRYLAKLSPVTAIDLSDEALSRLASRLPSAADVSCMAGDICDPLFAAFLGERQFDTIVSSNVLEHIEDDSAAVARMRGILTQPGSNVVIVVPAHELLFGTLDSAAGHYRRYSRAGLCRLFESGGFEVVRTTYFNWLGAIAWLVNGRILRQTNLNARSVETQARLFDHLMVPVLRATESIVSPPFGQSLVLVARPSQ